MKGGRGWSGFTRSDDVEVKIRNKTMMLIMHKQQSGGIKQPITEPPRLPVSQRNMPTLSRHRPPIDRLNSEPRQTG